MIKNKIITKIIALIMLAITIISSLPISSLAAMIDLDDDADFGVVSGSKNDYGHELHYAKVDGKNYLVFCTQYGKTSPSGSTYKYKTDFTLEYQSDRKSYKKVAEMIYFGYVMTYGTGLPKTDAAKKAACATQQYVWEYIKNNINSSYGSPGRNTWDSSYMSSSLYTKWLDKTKDLYDKYHDKTISLMVKLKN